MALLIIIKTFAKLLIKNCTFMLNQLIFSDLYNSMIVIAMKTFNVTITFLNCNFHQNNGWHSVISILTSVVQSHSENSTCPTRPNIILEGCDFINNVSSLVEATVETNIFCMLNMAIIGPSFVTGNNGLNNALRPGIVTLMNTFIKIIWPVLMSHNRAAYVILCQYNCDMLFSEEIMFTSNECLDSIMYIYSSTAYLTVMEYSNIVFTNNKISNDIISFQPFDQSNPYMFCGFQYVTLNNVSIVSSKHYNITFHNNLLQNVALKPQGPCQLHFHHFTTHCRWIPSSVFYGYNPGVINQ